MTDDDVCYFLIVNVGTIGIFYGVYGTKRKYEEGMLMGVHLPGSAAESEEVKMLMKKLPYMDKMVLYFELAGRNCGMRILLLVYFGLYDRVEYMACGGVHRSDSSII